MICRGHLGIKGSVDRLDGDVDRVDSLPRPLEVRPTGTDDAYHRVAVTLPLLFIEVLGHRRVQARAAFDAIGPAERRQYRTLVLLNGEKAGKHDPHGEV